MFLCRIVLYYLFFFCKILRWRKKEPYCTNIKIFSEGEEKNKKMKAGMEINLMNCQLCASSEKL